MHLTYEVPFIFVDTYRVAALKTALIQSLWCPYFNTDTGDMFVKRTRVSVPLVSVLTRLYCRAVYPHLK